MADASSHAANAVSVAVPVDGASERTSSPAFVNNQHIRMPRKIYDNDAEKEFRGVPQCPRVNCPEKIVSRQSQTW